MNLVAAIEWAEGCHRRGLYSPIGVAFHWVMAALMVFQLAHGWYLGWQPVGGDKYLGYQTHTQIGLTIMLLGTLRFFWHSQLSGPGNVDEASLAGRASRLLQAWCHGVFAQNHRLRQQVTPARRGRRKTETANEPAPARHVSMSLKRND